MSTSVAAVASSFPTVSFRFIDEWLSVYEGDFARRVLSPYVGLPFIIFIVGASALVVYAFALVIRGCCFKPPARQSKRLSSIAVASVSLTLLGVIVINLGNLGIVAFEKGTLRVTSNVQAVESQLRKASLLLGDIQSSASSLANNDQLGACSLPKALYMPNKTLEVVLRAVSDISSTTVVYASQGLYVINSLLTTLSSLLAPMSQYSSQAILASYIVYGVLFAVFIMFALSVLCKSSGFIKLCVAFGFVFTMFLTILCCIKMIFIPVVGNYCLDTRNNAMEIIKDQRSTGVEAKAFAYLIECPITIAEQDSKILREALNALDKLLSSETLLTQAVLQAKSVFSDAGSDASVADCSYALASTFESVRKLSISVRMLIPALDCAQFSDAWIQAVEIGVCDECLGGFFFIWIFQFIASLLLFIIISIAAVLFIEFDAPSPQNRNRESTYIYHSQSAPSSEIELTELDEECKVSHEPSAPPPPNV